MSLLTENNRQYYEGAQGFRGDGTTVSFTTTFNTNLVFGAASNTNINYSKNNFKIYISATATPGSWSEVIADYTVEHNTIIFNTPPANNLYVVVQLKKLDGGNYGNTLADKAYGSVVEENYGSYAYISLDDVVNNFLVAYVGDGKLIPSVKRTDVVFHAKRGLQEFSYDTLKSVNKLEVTVPHNLSIPMPQDYVNYVNLYWIDNSGVKHVIMPGDGLTTNPTNVFLDDNKGVPIQDEFGNNIDTTSITDYRWKNNFLKNANNQDLLNDTILGWEYYYGYPEFGYGQLFGLDPQFANANGYFTIDERYNKFSFSANLVDRVVVIEYISDGLSTDVDTRIPKMAEEAIYAHISHAIIASQINQPEYVVMRLKKERSAKLRNAKIRLSNIKLNEIVQVMRGKSKWIKH
jgi:hypothetical protein